MSKTEHSSWLDEKYPLLVKRKLATLLGLNESMLLQQIEYWLNGKRERGEDKYFIEERWWVYNTYKDWRKQFPFWSKHTIRRAIESLEKDGILISDNFNKLGFDRTKWYSIDYERLDEVCSERLEELEKEGENPVVERIVQNGQVEKDNLDRPIPKTSSTKISIKTYNSDEKSDDIFDTVTSSQLKSKKPTNYNTPELIAMLQQHAIDADVVFKANKLDGDDRNKVLGQVEDLKNNLGGPANVVRFYRWFFKDPRRIEKFRDIELHKKVGVIVTNLDDYKTARDNERVRLQIELTGPTSQYTREDLTGLTLEELEELERDMREPIGENEQSMAKARAILQ